MRKTWVRPLGQEDPTENEMATHSSILAWGIPWTEEPGGLQSMGSQSWTQLSDYTTTTKHYVCLKCTHTVLIFAYIHESSTTVKAINMSIIPKSFLYFFFSLKPRFSGNHSSPNATIDGCIF